MDRVVSNWMGLSKAQRRSLLMSVALLLVCGWLYLAGHARYGLFDVDEAIFTRATIEMRESGSLAMPTYNGEPRYHKPPLIYWLQDAAMEVLGEDSLYAARLPSALSALLTIILLGFGVWRLTGNRRWALTSAAMLGLSLSFLVVGRAATADGVLNLFSLALMLWVLDVMYKVRRRGGGRHDFVVSGVLAALGFLAKGPIAWVPAGIVVLVLLAVRKEREVLWQRLQPWRSAAVLGAALLPWVLLLLGQHGVGFFYEFFIVHNVGRYVGGMSNTQSSSPLYYVVVVAIGFFPWVLFLPKAVMVACKGGWVKVQTALTARDIGRVLPPLCMIVAFVYIGFFSLSGTKLAHYIVPAYPALAVLVAWWVTMVPRSRLEWWQIVVAMGWAVVMALPFGLLNSALMGLRQETLIGWLGWLQVVTNMPWPLKDPLAAAVLAQLVELDAAPTLVALLVVACVVPAFVLVGMGYKRAVWSVCVAWAMCLGLVVWGVVPVVWQYTQAPLLRLAERVEVAPENVPVIHLGLHKPSVLYATGRRFLKLERPLQLPDYIVAPETLVLAEAHEVQAIELELGTSRKGQILSRTCDGGYCLLVVGKI